MIKHFHLHLLACTALVAMSGFASLSIGVAHAETAVPAPGQPQPEAEALPPAIPKPLDKPFPGALKLAVDATDLVHHVMSVHETIPVPEEARANGQFIVLYPKWLPGNHSPSGSISEFGGLVVKSGGKVIEWMRDPVDVFAFHIPVTKTQASIDVDFKLLSPVTSEEGRVVMTPHMANVQWNQVALYPAGYYARDIKIDATLKLPPGWQAATALRPVGVVTSGSTTFGTVTFNTLVDSPVLAGEYVRKTLISAQGATPVTLNMVADKPADLEYSEAELQAHRNLVTQAIKTFGSQHYDHYDFLMALTDELGGIGLEHHRSSEDSVSEDYFTDWAHSFPQRDLLAHEYTHSWNGKYRRPADLYGPTFNDVQRGSLLWVYEGQTQYWGNVLAARSGLVSKEQGLDALGLMAATYSQQAGREWRAVVDTTNDPTISQRRPKSWRDYQRSEDYYVEGQLVWLEADTLIRKLTHESKSLDDFAKAFFGTNDGSYVTSTYTFDDVVRTLNGVAPYDWAKFLRDRIYSVHPQPPVAGLEQGGYRLVYSDKPNAFMEQAAKNRHQLNLMFSLGMSVTKKGTLGAVHWEGPAYNAGLVAHDEIVAVNGESYTPELLTAAIKDATKPTAAPIELLIRSGAHVRTVKIPYHGGMRYPHLERIPGTPDRLDAIYSPR
ncbi:M61 family metallopeptidase [Brytella acorum]|uniref:M61 family metallopeptidase n=1 Tax=Brytella acorum TaxID=2959299 RepID=UPI0025AE5FF1|nr:peptidase M61 [Brytella acorum]MDF3623681.1 peptidase M61 [Brytella acorum]